MDYKEYSRLRSIARKRLERAAAAGLIPPVQIPTVKQVKASGNPEQFLASVKQLLNVPTVREFHKQDIPKADYKLPSIPAAPAVPKKMTEAERKARRNEQKRRSRAKRAVEQAAPSEAEGRKRVGYLRALETVSKKWREAGVDVGNWLGVMSPGMSKKFVEYMEYRFSQGDYKNRYTIDTFIRDFGTLVQKGYDFKDIQTDFGAFLQKQKQLGTNRKRTNKYGIDSDEVDQAWRKFVNR